MSNEMKDALKRLMINKCECEEVEDKLPEVRMLKKKKPLQQAKQCDCGEDCECGSEECECEKKFTFRPLLNPREEPQQEEKRVRKGKR